MNKNIMNSFENVPFVAICDVTASLMFHQLHCMTFLRFLKFQFLYAMVENAKCIMNLPQSAIKTNIYEILLCSQFFCTSGPSHSKSGKTEGKSNMFCPRKQENDTFILEPTNYQGCK
ncbi:hypothetical protein OS493_014398 [Desmophyllum pertusum]|uniref:Uncharacterized protein n=1 Tax=Desmophyllum pertusum TaxID=174260 RepID=A0A9W9YSD8_9CNID|nr:hypothetical protein OS493_014398 [Desmophyllum pertusum]